MNSKIIPEYAALIVKSESLNVAVTGPLANRES